MPKIYYIVLISSLFISGCWPKPHKLTINQGNLLEQSAIDRLQIGMNKEQVQYLIGSPILEKPFDKQQWDYIYIVRKGHKQTEKRLVSLTFSDDNTLLKIEGDLSAPETTEKTKK